MTYPELKIGEIVQWNDPDNDISTGEYKVVGLPDNSSTEAPDLIELQGRWGSEVEALRMEISTLNTYPE